MNQFSSKNIMHTEEDALDLSSLFYEIKLNKWLILLVTLMTLTIGSIYVYFKIPQYESDVLLQIDAKKGSLSQGGLIEQLALGGASDANEAQTQTALIQSRFIIDPIIQSLHLDIDLSVKKHAIRDYLSFKKSTSHTQIKASVFNVPTEKINKKYTIKVNKPGFVQLFDEKNRLVLDGKEGDLLSNNNAGIQMKIALGTSPMGSQYTIVKRSKIEVRNSILKHLSIQESGAKGRQVATGILTVKLIGPNPGQIVRILNQIALTAQSKDIKKKAQEASKTLDFLQQQLPITEEQLKQAEYQLNRYRAQSGKIDLEFQTQALLARFSEIEKEISRIRVEKENMKQQYTLKHPMMIAINQQLKSFENQRIELEQALRKLPDSDQVAVNLLREVTVKKELYVILLSKIQELQVVKAGTISSVRILGFAKLPERPLPSRAPLIYLVSAALGFILSFVIIVIHRMLSSKINDPHWAEHHFNLPNLAIIPHFQSDKTGSKKIGLIAHTHPKNITVESLRSLRTNIQLTLNHAQNNIVSILGITPGVGKSFVSANMAYLLASAGKKVLLIDADLRKGALHQYFNTSHTSGLTEVLNGSSTLDRAIHSTHHQNLSCLPRGAYPENPSELLMSASFKALLPKLSAHYDVIIIDTTPILLVTDAVLVSGLAGTNYLVFSPGSNEPVQIEMALKRLHSAGVSLQGSIFNYTKPQLNKMLANKYAYEHYTYSNYAYASYCDDTINEKIDAR